MNRFPESMLFGLLVFIATADPATAADFFGLGFTISPEAGSIGAGLSSDGKIAVGQSGLVPEQFMEGFRWTREGGLEGLGGAPGTPLGTSASDVALDGTVVGLNFLIQAVEWSPDKVLQVLPNLPPSDAASGMFSEANAISENAQWIVGTSWDSAGNWTAVRWNADRQITRLPFTNAYDVSGDGSVVVGTQSDLTGSRAVRWTEAEGLQELGELPGRRNISYASRVSANGNVVIGAANSPTSPDNSEPFRWTAAGGMIGLGLLPGFDGGGVAGVSADGEVIVGNNFAYPPSGDPSRVAVIWTEKLGLLDLSEYLKSDVGLADQLAGWHLIAGTGVSRDGQVIVGHGINPQGDHEAWMAIVPEPPSGALAAMALAMATLLSVWRRDWRWREQ